MTDPRLSSQPTNDEVEATLDELYGVSNLLSLYYWVSEREKIRLAKERGLPAPWTTDSILTKYRFCNVRREDDRVTVWIKENIREPYANHPYLWLMLCLARQLNWPPTLAYLIQSGAWPIDDSFDPRALGAALNAWKASGQKVYTGAYMISAPATKGQDKQTYLAEAVIGALWANRALFTGVHDVRLQSFHHYLTQFRGWGQFMAYQVVVDLRFTRVLERAPDRHAWAAAGPGTLRGLNRIAGRKVDAPLSQATALSEMRRLYPKITAETGVELDFSDVPNVLCETDKYLRVLFGEGAPRTLYVEGRGS